MDGLDVMETPATEGAVSCAAAGRGRREAASGAASASHPSARRNALARGFGIRKTKAACMMPPRFEAACTVDEPMQPMAKFVD